MWGEKMKFVCKLFRTEHAQISGYPLEYPWLLWHCDIKGLGTWVELTYLLNWIFWGHDENKCTTFNFGLVKMKK